MKYIVVFLLPFLLVSCASSISGFKIGIVGLVVIFGTMLLLFALMFFLIAKRKKKGEKNLVKFNNDVYIALNKLDTPQQKINMLKNLLERINNDEKYAKDTEWRDKVLVKVYMYMATTYYKSGEEIESLNMFTRIIDLDDSDGMAYYNRGSIYNNMGLYKKALLDLNKTIELMPDYTNAYNNRGLAHERMEHYQEALSDFGEAINLEHSSIAYYNRGNTNFQMEDYKSALVDYRSALSVLDASDQPDFRKEIEMGIEVVEAKLK